MSKSLKKIKIACRGLWGLFMSLLSFFLKKNVLKPNCSGPKVIVSVSSFGKRAEKTLPVTLRSLLLQKRLPDKIVVWLDEESFSESNLPKSLSSMRKYGVEIRYCHDLKSYTKLVPSLMEFPDDVIITVDDDQYYCNNMILALLKGYEKHPDHVICSLGHVPCFDSDGMLLPYNSWTANVRTGYHEILFPLGVGGVLYPPRSLYSDVTDSNLFLSLSPYADDIWFWTMELKKGTKSYLADLKRMPGYPIDLIDQLVHKGQSLMDINVRNNRNDVQIHDVFNHYGISPDKDGVMELLNNNVLV